MDLKIGMVHYPGILDGKGKVWGVRVPDMPGCHGGGASPDAAIADAISAMREWAADTLGQGGTIPPARTVHAIMADKNTDFDPKQGETFVMLPLLLDRGRPVRANLSLDAGLLETIDAEAAKRGLTRSAFLVSAAIDKIERGG